MPTSYPGSIDSLPRPSASSPMTDATTYAGHTIIDNLSDAIEALETKLGTLASVPAANSVLRGTGAGASAFGALVNADVSASAAIAISKLAAGSAGQEIETVSGVSTWLTVPSARVYHNADQSIANSTETVLAFNSERFDTASLHDTATNNSRLTAPIAGKYLIGINVRWENNQTGTRILSIRHGGVTDIAANYMPATVQAVHTVTTLYALNAGEYVQVFVTHFAGVALNIQAAGNISPEFWMIRISA